MLSDIRGQLVGASSDSTVMPAVVTTCASGSSCSFWPTTLISWGLLPSESLRLPLLLEEEEELDDEELLDDELDDELELDDEERPILTDASKPVSGGR
mmetsp:Transcript_12401/g.29288  ORF Transcript_12401/g.29288 Transcript_12401/m.29288 type:complete len:98 (+) Transcript_12401:321-614(+)